jgi:hypothetical protein
MKNALTFDMTFFSCQDGIHLGQRQRLGLDSGLERSLWTMTVCKERLGMGLTSLGAVGSVTVEIVHLYGDQSQGGI